MKYQLKREQQLFCDMNSAWDFFSSPVNLSKITPPEMRFTIISDSTNKEIFEGLIINYKIYPFLGIPLKWRTKITQVARQKSFTDFQEKGPYKYWNHLHEFIPNNEGVLMKDTVVYDLPFGILGKIAHRIFVRKKLEKIFNYRYAILENKFNKI